MAYWGSESYTADAYKKYIYTHPAWKQEAKDYEARLGQVLFVAPFTAEAADRALAAIQQRAEAEAARKSRKSKKQKAREPEKENLDHYTENLLGDLEGPLVDNESVDHYLEADLNRVGMHSARNEASLENDDIFNKSFVLDENDEAARQILFDTEEEEDEAVAGGDAEVKAAPLDEKMTALSAALTANRTGAGRFFRRMWLGIRTFFKSHTGEGMMRSGSDNLLPRQMLQGYMALDASKEDLLAFRLALIGWRIKHGANTLYEVMAASHDAGLRGTENLDEAADMYRDVDPLHSGDLRSLAGKNNMFPHEIVYLRYIDENQATRENKAGQLSKLGSEDREAEDFSDAEDLILTEETQAQYKDDRIREHVNAKIAERQAEYDKREAEIADYDRTYEEKIKQATRKYRAAELARLEGDVEDPALVLSRLKAERSGGTVPFDPDTRYNLPAQFKHKGGKAPGLARQMIKKLRSYDDIAMSQNSVRWLDTMRYELRKTQNELDKACQDAGVETYDFLRFVPTENFADYYQQKDYGGNYDAEKDPVYLEALKKYQEREQKINESTLPLPAELIPEKKVPEHLPDPESYRDQYTREVKEQLDLSGEIEDGLRKSQSVIHALDYTYSPRHTYYDNKTSANKNDPRKLAVSVYTSPAYRRMNNIMNYGIFGRFESPSDLAKKGKTPYDSYEVEEGNKHAVERSLHFIRMTARLLLDTLQDWGNYSASDLSEKGQKDLNRKGAATALAARGENKKDSASSGEFTLNKLTSTSKNFEVAKHYYNLRVKDSGYDNASLTILALKGYNGVDIEGLSKNTSTEQVLLPKGTRMKILRTWTSGLSSKDLHLAFRGQNINAILNQKPAPKELAREKREHRKDPDSDKEYDYIGVTVAEELPPQGDAAIRKEEIRSSMDPASAKGKRYKKMLDSLYYARDMLKQAKA